MWPFVVVWWHIHVAGRNFEESSNTEKVNKNFKNTRKSSSLLNVMVSCSCDEHIFGMGFNVFECAGKVILEDGYHHTVVWQRYCRKLTF